MCQFKFVAKQVWKNLILSYFSLLISLSIVLSICISLSLFLNVSLCFSPYSVSLSSKITICFYFVSLFQYSNYLCNPLSVRISVSLICLTISLLLLCYFISISLSLFLTLLFFCYWFFWLFFLSVSRSKYLSLSNSYNSLMGSILSKRYWIV